MTLFSPIPFVRALALPLALVAALACADVGAATEAGTVIRNRADISWIDADTGEIERAHSNASTVIVAAVRRLAVDGTLELQSRAGALSSLAFRLVNTGNIAERYTLSLVDAADDAGALGSLAVHLDLDGNGVVDPGEPALERTPLLEPGASLALVALARVPDDARANERFELALRAVDSADTEARSVSAIDVVAGARLVVDKDAALECAVDLAAGERIVHRVGVTNDGGTAPSARAVRIDGATRDGVLVVDRIPAGLRLASGEPLEAAPAGALALVPAAGDDAWTSASRAPAESTATRVALFVPAASLAAGEGASLGYTLEAFEAVPAGAAGRTLAGTDLDGDGRDDAASEPLCAAPGSDPDPDPEPTAGGEASIAFVMASDAIRRAGALPAFGTAEDFVEVASYPLAGRRGDYAVGRDGLYLTLTTRDFPDGVVLGDAGPSGRSVVVTLESLGTGDALEVVLLETEPGSGVFRSVRPIALGTTVRGAGGHCPGAGTRPLDVAPDYAIATPECALLSEPGDTLRVLFGDAGAEIELIATVTVAPVARVFDAHDLEPVAGATITFHHGPPDAVSPPVVRDAVSERPLVRVSDEDGLYDVPTLPPGSGYHVRVEPPAGYRFPSVVAPADLDPREVLPSAYGAGGFGAASGVFDAVAGEATPLVDIPLDPLAAASRLTLAKRALVTETEPGGLVAYAIELGNRGDSALADLRVEDRLPFGFRLVRGSVRIDGERVADPDGTPGPTLAFALGALGPEGRRELEYVLEATAGAIDGDGINVATASARTASGVTLVSPESRVRVRVSRGGVLSGRAALFGKLYVDANCNALHDAAEWPLGGVRLYLDDGTFAITDENGQYSLYGLEAGTRALRIDPITVPEGLRFKPIDNANAASGDSRFVTLSPGDYHRADFALSCPAEDTARVLAEIRERNASIDGGWLLEEAERFEPLEEGARDERVDAPGDADIDGDLSNGILNGPDAGRTRRSVRAEDEGDAERPADAGAAANAAAGDTADDATGGERLDPQRAAATITAAQARAGTWLWPTNGTSLDGRFVAVVRAGVEPTLYVDDVPVPASRIGERIENRRESAQIVAWYGVPLEPGPNRVEVRGSDPFGNIRTLAKGVFKRPAGGRRMVLRARTDTLPADGGRSVLPIEIVVLDANDYPASGVHFVTLETSETGEGSWLEEDLRPDEPGHQVRVEDGFATATLRSSDRTGALTVRARADAMGANLRVFQVAALRPLFGVGVLELGVVSSELMGEGFAPEAEFDALAGDTRGYGRLSMFLKGRVRGDAQLTLSYDSAKDGDTELLRDIDPGAHYPIHGDASVRGYEAQSRSRLYAKLERGKSSVMWGDYVTDADADVEDLARVQRVLTGFNARLERGPARFQLFAATSEDGRGVEEIPGNGTALLYRLAGAPIVPNSERVELVVRDRENPGLVVSSRALSRFGDYTVDSLGGELSFAAPVPSVDESLNPVFVRVTYDRETGGERHLVAGARARVALGESVVVGASVSDDDAPLAGGTVGGAHVAWRPREGTAATLGVARATHADGRASGDAQRLSIEHAWGGTRERRTELVAARAEEGFDGAGSSVAPGRRELRLEHAERLTPSLRATLEASHSEALAVEELRRTFGATFERSLERWSVRGGARRIRQRDARADESFTTALAGAERRFEVFGRAASANVEYERDVARADRDRLALGGTLQVHEHMGLTARYERQRGILGLSSLGGERESETLVVGAESDLIENTRLYSEYRLRGGIGGRDLATASGVRGSYELEPGLTLSPALERIDTIAGDRSADGVALSVGASDTRNPNVRINGQAEYRDGRSADYVGLRGSYAARLDLDWTAIVREDFRRQVPVDGSPDFRHAFTLGLARRPRLDNRHHLLFQYQWKVERAEGEARDRDVHVLSTHQNVKVGPDLVLSGRLGGKRQTTHLSGGTHDSAAYVADARAIWDIDRRWSLDLRAGVLASGNGARSRRHALGVGVAHVLDRDLQIELGYNVAGFRDEDLDPDGHNARGIRFGLRYKFDERAFGWLEDGRSED